MEKKHPFIVDKQTLPFDHETVNYSISKLGMTLCKTWILLVRKRHISCIAGKMSMNIVLILLILRVTFFRGYLVQISQI